MFALTKLESSLPQTDTSTFLVQSTGNFLLFSFHSILNNNSTSTKMMSKGKKIRVKFVNPFNKNKKQSNNMKAGASTSKQAPTKAAAGSDITDEMCYSPTSVASSTMSSISSLSSTSESERQQRHVTIESDWSTMQRDSIKPSPPGLDCTDKEVAETADYYGYDTSAVPDGAAAPDAVDLYGYGEAVPDNAEASPSTKAAEDYGYGEAVPDRATNNGSSPAAAVDLYGYGDAAPDRVARSSSPSASADLYGYGDGAPSGFDSRRSGSPPSSSSRRATPRRSSMKQGGSSGGRQRRSSIGYTGEIENVLPSSNGKKVKRRTSISFNDTVRVKTCEPVKNLTDEPEALWFQDDEFRKIKEKCFNIVDKVDQGMTGGKRYCTRGLERMSVQTRRESLGRKHDAWDSVLNEQDQQRHDGEYDEDHISNVYKFSTIKNQKEAADRATQDAAEIENYLRSTRRMRRRCSM